MSEIEEAAAKWAVVEEYQKAKASVAALKNRLAQWGKELEEVGGALQSNPTEVEIPALPSQDELQRAATDCKFAELSYGQSLERLRELGIEPQ
jgi:hypothetical protein